MSSRTINFNTGRLVNPFSAFDNALGKNGVLAQSMIARDAEKVQQAKLQQQAVENQRADAQLLLRQNADTRAQSAENRNATEAQRLVDLRQANQDISTNYLADKDSVGKYGNTINQVSALNEEMSRVAGLNEQTLDGNHIVSPQEADALSQAYAKQENMDALERGNAMTNFGTVSDQETAVAQLTQQYVQAGNNPQNAAAMAQAQTGDLLNRTNASASANASMQQAFENQMKVVGAQNALNKTQASLLPKGKSGGITLGADGSISSGYGYGMKGFKTYSNTQAQNRIDKVVDGKLDGTNNIIGKNNQTNSRKSVELATKLGVSKEGIANALDATLVDGKWYWDTHLSTDDNHQAFANLAKQLDPTTSSGAAVQQESALRYNMYNEMSKTKLPNTPGNVNLFRGTDAIQADLNKVMYPTKTKSRPKTTPKPQASKSSVLTNAQKEAKQYTEDYQVDKKDEVSTTTTPQVTSTKSMEPKVGKTLDFSNTTDFSKPPKRIKGTIKESSSEASARRVQDSKNLKAYKSAQIKAIQEDIDKQLVILPNTPSNRDYIKKSLSGKYEKEVLTSVMSRNENSKTYQDRMETNVSQGSILTNRMNNR